MVRFGAYSKDGNGKQKKCLDCPALIPVRGKRDRCATCALDRAEMLKRERSKKRWQAIKAARDEQ
jgi:hypothetical protein